MQAEQFSLLLYLLAEYCYNVDYMFFFKVSLTDSTAFYTKCNSSGRPHQVWRHDAGHPRDTLLFEEKDPRCVAPSLAI